jgi:adenylosuccinate synthase
MAIVVVVGMQWGDEAKGKVVDYLAQDADYVVRYNGGNNAGHTVVVGDEVFKFHTVPVGVLNDGVTAVITDGVVFDPSVFVGEIEGLRKRGITPDRIRISGNAHVIMPYHRLLDRLEEESKGNGRIGTTGRGIGPCYADKMSRTGIRIWDLVDPERFRSKLSQCVEQKNKIITSVYNAEPLNETEIYDEYSRYAEQVRPYVCETSTILSQAVRERANILFEGAHGTLLDIDYGTYPYVTSSHCVSGGACIGTGIGPTEIDRVIGVAKAYTTRVGAGPCPTELKDAIGDRIRERGREYGTTTGRPRRCGWFDAVAVKYAARINGVSAIALTLLDVLSGFDTVKICVGYSIEGRETAEFTTDVDSLWKAVPIYEELPGWHEDISSAGNFEDLPAAARRYVDRVSQIVGVPVCLVGVGPRRDQTIVLDGEILQMS